MGGFHWARLWHFLIMWAMLAFVFGHLVMVVLHGWNNFVSMFTGWKKDPEYPIRIVTVWSCRERKVRVRIDAGRSDFAGIQRNCSSTKRC